MKQTKPVVPNFVVQEEGARKVLVYLNMPELKVKRSFPKFWKFVPANGHVEELAFEEQSLKFSINIRAKLYSISIARLPGEIRSNRCSIKYQRGGCWITLLKVEPMPWMNRICDDLNPGLDVYEDDNQSPLPTKDVQPKDNDTPLPFNLVPLASSPSSRRSVKKPSSWIDQTPVCSDIHSNLDKSNGALIPTGISETKDSKYTSVL